MQLSEKHILDFQKLYKKHFGKEISKKEALGKGLCVLKMVRQMVVVPLKKKGIKNDEQH